MNRLFIIDIDGCILNDIFINFDNIMTVKEIRDKLKKEKIFDMFFDFVYNQIGKNDEIIFISGRKENELGKITRKQFKPLDNMRIKYRIIYFPESLEVNKNNYYWFKVLNCNNLILKHSEKRIIVIDDNDYWFKGIIEMSFQDLFRVNGKNNDWYDVQEYLIRFPLNNMDLTYRTNYIKCPYCNQKLNKKENNKGYICSFLECDFECSKKELIYQNWNKEIDYY